MLEKDIENLIAQHPDDIFPGEDFSLIKQQFFIEGRRIDILFEDKHKRKIVVEVKRGILNREAAGQIAEYYGLLKNENKEDFFELILCANVIPKERKLFLENIGIECKELGISFVTQLAKKYSYTFTDERTSEETPKKEIILHDSSVWIFQGNPNRYDILNALTDADIGNEIHWQVNQNKNKIKQGHLGLIWMSGKDAGIYALTRIECDPTLLEEYENERKYWLNSREKKVALRVKMTVIKRLINNPLLKDQLKKIKELESLSIFRYSQGTNFPVSNIEWKEISKLI